jgi:hypothetical protein
MSGYDVVWGPAVAGPDRTRSVGLSASAEASGETRRSAAEGAAREGGSRTVTL